MHCNNAHKNEANKVRLVLGKNRQKTEPRAITPPVIKTIISLSLDGRVLESFLDNLFFIHIFLRCKKRAHFYQNGA